MDPVCKLVYAYLMRDLCAVLWKLILPNALWLIPWYWQPLAIIADGHEKACVDVWAYAMLFAIPASAIAVASTIFSACDVGSLMPDDLEPAAPFVVFILLAVAFLLPIVAC